MRLPATALKASIAGLQTCCARAVPAYVWKRHLIIFIVCGTVTPLSSGLFLESFGLHPVSAEAALIPAAPKQAPFRNARVVILLMVLLRLHDTSLPREDPYRFLRHVHTSKIHANPPFSRRDNETDSIPFLFFLPSGQEPKNGTGLNYKM